MFQLVLVLSALILGPTAARSVPYLYESDPLEPIVHSTVSVVLRASDGFTQEQDGFSNQGWHTFPGSTFSAIAEETGILAPVIRIDELRLRAVDISFSGAFADGTLPYTLTIDEIIATAIGDPLGAPDGTGSNGSVTLDGAKSIAFSGRLDVIGEVLPFAFDIPLGTPSPGSGLLNLDASWSGGDSFDVNEITVGSGNRFVSQYQEIGSASGVLWTANVQSRFITETLYSTIPVPEPSTALLMGLGLVGLGVRRRA